jgi:uncharacterized protein (DUF58 family)
LVALALGVGTAAYNSSSNILFITLSLLLACLILSGVLSWLNFARVRWRLLRPPVARAGRETTVTVEMSNGKKLLPTYGLECFVSARPAEKEGAARPQSTFTARGQDVRAILRRHDGATPAVLRLGTRLDPRDTVRLDMAWRPPRRGRWRLEIRHVGSLFPFGFFNKRLTTTVQRELIVWPAPIDCRRQGAAGRHEAGGSKRVARAGGGSDLLALRRYASGDSHRLVHWKASARTGQLLVRRLAAERVESHTLWLQTDAWRWPDAAQFERALSLCATLAEMLFREGSLHAVALDGEPPRAVRRVRDLEDWLDRISLVQLGKVTPGPAIIPTRGNLMTFRPDGGTGVVAIIHGEKAATA